MQALVHPVRCNCVVAAGAEQRACCEKADALSLDMFTQRLITKARSMMTGSSCAIVLLQLVLSSVHAVKGLEFVVCFVVGLDTKAWRYALSDPELQQVSLPFCKIPSCKPRISMLVQQASSVGAVNCSCFTMTNTAGTCLPQGPNLPDATTQVQKQ